MEETNNRKQLRLFAFPYAGGSSNVYFEWKTYLPDEVDFCPVELPGRGRRLTEELCQDMSCLVQDAEKQLEGKLDLPFAFFGYSMGACLAYELAVRLQGKERKPVALFVAASRAPHLSRPVPETDHLSDEALIKKLRELNGTPKEVWENEELLKFVLPIVRADFSVVRRYVYQPASPLDLPIVAFKGERDPDVSKEALIAWENHTDCSFRHYEYPGDHFFIHTSKEEFLTALCQELQKLMKEKVN